MPQFAYEARSDEGRPISGVIAADTMESAGQKLSESGYFVVKLGPTGSAAESNGPHNRNASRLKGPRASVMWFMNQLSVMIDTGITIGDALDCLARQAKEPAMRKILQSVSESIQEGRPLSDAMERHPRAFPSAAVAMLRAAEASGTLTMTLTRIAEYMSKDLQTVRKFRGALIYPGMMAVMCVSVTVFLLTVILPRFESIYASKGAVLPAPTRVLMVLSRLLTQQWMWLAPVVLVAVGSAVWFFRTPRGRALFDGWQLRLPVLGNIVHKFLQNRAFRTLGTLLESGIPIDQALALLRSTSSNTRYRQMWTKAEEDVTNGQRLVASLAGSALIPEPIVQMMDCGERTGRLGQIFTRLATFTEKEYDQAITTTAQLVEPAMILVMGSIIGFVAIALLLPIFGSATVMAH